MDSPTLTIVPSENGAEPIVERISESDANWLHAAVGEAQAASQQYEAAKQRFEAAQAAYAFVLRRFKVAYGLDDRDQIELKTGAIVRAIPEVPCS